MLFNAMLEHLLKSCQMPRNVASPILGNWLWHQSFGSVGEGEISPSIPLESLWLD